MEVNHYQVLCCDANGNCKENLTLITDLITAFALWQSRTAIALGYSQVTLSCHLKRGKMVILQEFTR